MWLEPNIGRGRNLRSTIWRQHRHIHVNDLFKFSWLAAKSWNSDYLFSTKNYNFKMKHNHSALSKVNIFTLILSISALRKITKSHQNLSLYTGTSPVLTDPWLTGLIWNQATINCLHITGTGEKTLTNFSKLIGPYLPTPLTWRLRCCWSAFTRRILTRLEEKC